MAAAEVSDCNGVEFEGKARAGAEIEEHLKRGETEECVGGKDDSTDGSYEFVDDDKDSDEAVVEVDLADGSVDSAAAENGIAKEISAAEDLDGELGEVKGDDVVADGNLEVVVGEEEEEEEEEEDVVVNKDLGVEDGDCNPTSESAVDVDVNLPPSEVEDVTYVSIAAEECTDQIINDALESPNTELVADVTDAIELHDGACNGGSEDATPEKDRLEVVVEERTDAAVVQLSLKTEAKQDVVVTTVPAVVPAVPEAVPESDDALTLEKDVPETRSNGNSQHLESPDDLESDLGEQLEEESGIGTEDAAEGECVIISEITRSYSESQSVTKDISLENAGDISCSLANGESVSNGNMDVVSCPSNATVVENCPLNATVVDNYTEGASVDGSTVAHDGSTDGNNLDDEAESKSLENGSTAVFNRAIDEVNVGVTTEIFSNDEEVPVPCTEEEAELPYLTTKALIVKCDGHYDESEKNSVEGKSQENASPKTDDQPKTEDGDIIVEDIKKSPSEQSECIDKEIDSIEVPEDKEILPSTSADAVEPTVPGQIVNSDLKRLPCYMIRVPKFFDDKLMAQKEDLELQVDEKTRSRDSIKSLLQSKKDNRDEYSLKLDAARKEEKAVRDLFNAKRHELDVIQTTINKMKNATSIDEIDDKINDLEHRIQHETIHLREEKQILREIKTLKQSREKISSSLGPQIEILEAFDQKEQIEGKFEHLKQEFNSLRTKLFQVEMQTKSIKKKYDDECQSMRDLFAQRNAANDLRQETYSQLWSVKKEYLEKNSHFYRYKDDRRAADNIAILGDKESLQRHCADQVERIMQLWNNSDEFRNQYVKFNVPSTLRRFKTLDTRALGPDEAPTVLPNIRGDRLKNTSTPASKIEVIVPSERNNKKRDDQVTQENILQEPSDKVTQKIGPDKKHKGLIFIQEPSMALKDSSISVSNEPERENKRIEEDELTLKAKEIARQEEELKKEKAAAERKEKVRLEQMAKAKEAEARKRQKAEKAKIRAEFKAQKEAALKEKKRAKKESRKEKKMAGASKLENASTDSESLPDSNNSQLESVQEQDTKVTTAKKRASKTHAAAKQINKVKPLPLPLRNRGKRKMQTWMWMLLAAAVVAVLFVAGNYISFSEFKLRHLGY